MAATATAAVPLDPGAMARAIEEAALVEDEDAGVEAAAAAAGPCR